MRMLLRLISLAGLAYGLFLLGSLGLESLRAAPKLPDTPEPVPVPWIQNQAKSAFAGFPVGQPREVDLTVDETVLETLTPRERRDQLRDWMLWLVISDSGLSADQVNQCLHDVPSLRHGYMRPVASFEYGETRSCAIGDGRVVALIPKGTDVVREGHLGEVVDAQRKNLGAVPETLLIFEYELEADGLAARLTRLPDQKGPDWLTNRHGYEEARVGGLDDLKQFMARVDDLTFARVDGDRLVVGGRKIKGRPFRGITVEEVAAVWQSEDAIAKRRKKAEAETKAIIDGFKSRWANRTFTDDFQRMQLKQEQELDADRVRGQIEKVQRKNRVISGSGFSLDPTYDFEALAQFLERLESDLRSLGNRGGSLLPLKEVEEARAALTRHDRAPFHRLVGRLQKDEGFLTHTMGTFLETLGHANFANGDFDHEGLGRALERLRGELEALAAGTDGGAVATLGRLRSARTGLQTNDAGAYFQWLDELARGDGLIDRWLAAALVDLQRRHQSGRTTAPQGLARSLGRLEADLEALVSGGEASPLTRVREAHAALARHNAAPLRAIRDEYSKAEDPVLRAVAEVLSRESGWEGTLNAAEEDDLSWSLTLIETDLQDLTAGNPRSCTLGQVRAARSELAGGSDLEFVAILDRLYWEKSPLLNTIALTLERDSAQYKALDTSALAADLADLEAQIVGLVRGRVPVLTPDRVRAACVALKERDAAPFEALVKDLRANPSYAARSLGVHLKVQGDGFRLGNDPALSEQLRRFSDLMCGPNGPVGGLAPARLKRVINSLKGLPVPEPEGTNSKARGDALRRAGATREGEFLGWLESLQKSGNLVAMYLEFATERHADNYKFQRARYDGDLQGTEAGMVLFYTDLIAKLWGWDYLGSSPEPAIEGFVPETRLSVASIYLEEMERLSSTRLWFGHEDRGFQVAEGGNAVLLARGATRIYAASSNALRPGEEVTANALSEAFLGWWNDHYLEVARFEPEYERLNEIMKWSLVIGWLNQKDRGSLLGFLADYPVDRSRWFPEWVKRRPELKFRHWDRIGFLPRGYKGTTTETMPLLISSVYYQENGAHRIEGGVSLAPKELFATRLPIAEDISALMRRSNLIGEAGTGGRIFKTLQETKFTLKTIGADTGVLEAVPKAGTPLRSRFSEMLKPSFERVVWSEAHGMEVASRIGGKELVSLEFAPARNGFRLGVQGRELDTAQTLARGVSSSPDPLATLAAHPDVETVLSSGPNKYLVKTRGSESWVKLTGEAGEADVIKPTPEIDPGKVARVADLKPHALGFDVAIVDDDAARAEMGAREYLHFETPTGSPKDMTIATNARGPPAGARPLEVNVGNETIRGHIDPADGKIYLKRSEIPAALRDDVARLDRVFKSHEMRGIFAEVRSGGTAELRAAVGEVRYSGGQYVQEIRDGQYAKVADRLSRGPEGFRSELEAELSDGLKAVDRALEAGQSMRANLELQTLYDVYGELPDLKIRRALTEIKLGQAGKSAEAANSSLSTPLRRPNAFYEEVNARLSRPGLTALERENISRVAEARLWRDLKLNGVLEKARVALPEAKVSLFADGNRLALKCEIAKLPEGRALTSLEDVGRSHAPIYVQDTPGLNNLDWGVSVDKSLAAVMDQGLGEVIRLPVGPIADFSPAQIITTQNGMKLTCVKTGSSSWPAHSIPNSAQAARYYQSGSSNPDDDKKSRKEERERIAYFVLARTPK